MNSTWFHWQKTPGRRAVGKSNLAIMFIWIITCALLLMFKVPEPWAGVLRVAAVFGPFLLIAFGIIWLFRPKDKAIEPPRLIQEINKVLEHTGMTVESAGQTHDGYFMLISFRCRWFLPRVYLPMDCHPDEWAPLWKKIEAAGRAFSV